MGSNSPNSKMAWSLCQNIKAGDLMAEMLTILKTISPNMMRVERNNSRALEGNFRLPVGGIEMVKKVDKMYKSWYKLLASRHISSW
jgi:hypothetical protein